KGEFPHRLHGFGGYIKHNFHGGCLFYAGSTVYLTIGIAFTLSRRAVYEEKQLAQKKEEDHCEKCTAIFSARHRLPAFCILALRFFLYLLFSFWVCNNKE